MSKVKLYLPIGIIVLIAGVFIYNNSIKSQRNDEITSQSEVEEQNGDSFQVEEGILPSGFPQDFPIYPEAKLESSYQSKGDEVRATSVVWLVRASLDSVSGFYKSELVKSGRKINSTLEDENSVIISFEKGKE